MMRRAHTRLLLGFALSTAVVCFSSYIAVTTVSRYQRGAQRVAHTGLVLAESSALGRAFDRADIMGRGMSIDGEGEGQASLSEARQQVGTALARVRSLTADSGIQQANVAEAERQIRLRYAFMDAQIEVRRRAGFQAAMEFWRANHGLTLLANAEAALSNIYDEETRLLRARTEAAEAWAWRAHAGAVFVLVLGFGLLLLIYVLVRRDLQRRDLLLAQLTEIKQTLEAQTVELRASVLTDEQRRSLAELTRLTTVVERAGKFLREDAPVV